MSEEHPPEKHDEASKIVVVVLGAVLVIVGLGLLGQGFLGPMWEPIQSVWKVIRGLGWGLGLVIIGILVIVVSQRKGFRPPAKGTRLYRSRSDKMVSGVFGGLAKYLSMDATLLRLIYAGLALLFDVWPAIVAYIIASIIVPVEPEAPAEVPAEAWPAPTPPAPPAAPQAPVPTPPPFAPPAEQSPPAPAVAAPPPPPAAPLPEEPAAPPAGDAPRPTPPAADVPPADE